MLWARDCSLVCSLAYMGPWSRSISHKYEIVHACNSRMQGVETREPEIQRHLQLHSHLEASLGDKGPYLKKRKERKEGKKEGGEVRKGEKGREGERREEGWEGRGKKEGGEREERDGGVGRGHAKGSCYIIFLLCLLIKTILQNHRHTERSRVQTKDMGGRDIRELIF